LLGRLAQAQLENREIGGSDASSREGRAWRCPREPR